ncbi:hypothetical protein Glove_29g174 [Diversispora epigaea]|uniref:Dipeptidylpeptidase IV N-terminal domain-containing protein n=1 Tax=Diversispora epigaea TaxID=1348612 RepID=A0A397JSH9_9GLOM|nr:hypothetical protein Glove_29g174 [Diversispora epigaea]
MQFSLLFNDGTPKYLTSCNWKLISGVKVIDYTRQVCKYLMNTKKLSIEKHLYSVTFDGLTSTNGPEYYGVSFSFSKEKHLYSVTFDGLTSTNGPEYYGVSFSFSKGAKYYNIKYEIPKFLGKNY